MDKYYDLIPSQNTMYLMQKYTVHKNIVQIPVSFALDADVDFNLLTKALNVEIQRNDSLRLRFKKEKNKIVQYFLPEYKIESIKVLTFNTLEDQVSFFEKDAHKAVRFLRGECYRIYFFNAYNGYKGIFLDASHLAIDAMGILIFFLDLLSVYKALKNGAEMPAPLCRYEDYIVNELKILEDKELYKKGAAFYKEYHSKNGEPFYAGIHGPEYLEKTRIKEKNPDLRIPYAYNPLYDKAAVLDRLINTEDSKKILEFCQNRSVAPETILLLGLRTYLSKINYENPDVFLLVLCDKRIKYNDKRTGGCMAQPIQVRTVISSDKTFAEALNEMFAVRASLYKHLKFPYVHALEILRRLYNHKRIQAPAALMFSWLPIPVNRLNDFKMEFRTYNLGRYFAPMYLMCYPDAQSRGIVAHYMYRTKLITPEQVDDLHRNTIKIVLKGIENPDVTIKELFDIVDV